MPQPTRSTALATITPPVTVEVPPPTEDQRAVVYCDRCGGYHHIDAETRARWLAYSAIESDDELKILAATYDALNHALHTLGPVSTDRGGSGLLNDLLDAGQEYIEQLDRLLYPDADDLLWMDVE